MILHCYYFENGMRVYPENIGYDHRGMLHPKSELTNLKFHFDIMKFFTEHVKDCKFPHMDSIEDNYLVLPIHAKVTEKNVEKICSVIKSGW